MDVITYSLRRSAANSSEYYRKVAKFTDQVVLESQNLLSLVEEYQDYRGKKGDTQHRSYEEYLVELLTLGTLWNVYSGYANQMQGQILKILQILADLRQWSALMKPFIDRLRGILSTFYLYADPIRKTDPAEPTLGSFYRLIQWLLSTGEFMQETKILNSWYAFFATHNSVYCADRLGQIRDLATWFARKSELVLGEFTYRVEDFLQIQHPKHRWREDIIFSGRRRVEYHLNMVGAELMNRAFRSEFVRTKSKALFLPSCMQALRKPECQARSTSRGLVCSRCCPECNVHQLVQLGEKLGFEVLIIPHESSLFTKEKIKNFEDEDLGIIGVACLLNLTSGGWKAKGLGLPAQCVVLDYCGCQNHWHETGMMTEINLEELKRILNKEDVIGIEYN